MHSGCFSPAPPCCWGSRCCRPPSRWSRDQRSRLVTRRTGRLCGATTGPLRCPETRDALITQRSATKWANKNDKIFEACYVVYSRGWDTAGDPPVRPHTAAWGRRGGTGRKTQLHPHSDASRHTAPPKNTEHTVCIDLLVWIPETEGLGFDYWYYFRSTWV